MNFVFLLLKDHPTGLHMLDKCLQAGFKPDVVIEEDSKMALGRSEFYTDMMTYTPPTMKFLISQYNLNLVTVNNHNDETSCKAIQSANPELIVLGNTRIIKPDTFNIATHGCINVHPGPLPDVKGSLPVAWSIYTDKPVACTIHFIDEGLDTGNLITSQEIPIESSDTLDTLIEKAVFLSAELIVQTLKDYVKGTLTSYSQDLTLGNTYTFPDASIIDAVRKKLLSRQMTQQITS